VSGPSVRFAKTALDPVARNGVADGLTNAHPHAIHRQVVLKNPDRENACSNPRSSTKDCEKSFGQSKAVN
jgi:hypothetical protein